MEENKLEEEIRSLAGSVGRMRFAKKIGMTRADDSDQSNIFDESQPNPSDENEMISSSGTKKAVKEGPSLGAKLERSTAEAALTYVEDWAKRRKRHLPHDIVSRLALEIYNGVVLYERDLDIAAFMMDLMSDHYLLEVRNVHKAMQEMLDTHLAASKEIFGKFSSLYQEMSENLPLGVINTAISAHMDQAGKLTQDFPLSGPWRD